MELIKDTLFQLNVLVWACTNGPPRGWLVRPVLHDHGFQIDGFDVAMRLSSEVIGGIARRVDCGVAPEPDVVIWNPFRKTRVLVECKAQSFSPASSNSRQCRALLLAAGNNTARPIMPEASETFASYLLPEIYRDLQEATLQNLTDELGPLVFPYHCGASFVFGLRAAEGNVFLHISHEDSPFDDYPEEGLPIFAIGPDEAPVPLYQVALCPDAMNGSVLSSTYSTLVFFYRLVAELLSAIREQEGVQVLAFQSDEILRRLLNRLDRFWTGPKRKSMQDFTHAAVYKILREVVTKKSIRSDPVAHHVTLDDLRVSTIRNKLMNLSEYEWSDAVSVLKGGG